MPLMPCFQVGQAFHEGVILGRLFAGYGEIELQMCRCLIGVENWDFDGPIRKIFGKRGAESRIKIAKKALRDEFDKAGLKAELVGALANLDWCREIRNQYAHCNWGWEDEKGLFFVNLEELALHPQKIDKLMINERRIDVALLRQQENFFFYVKEAFYYLESAYTASLRKKSAPRKPSYVYQKPPNVARPALYN